MTKSRCHSGSCLAAYRTRLVWIDSIRPRTGWRGRRVIRLIHGCLLQAVTLACADPILLQVLARQLHVYGAESTIRIRFWIVAEGVKVSQVVFDGSESLLLVAPVVGEVSLTAGGTAHPLEGGRGNRLSLRRFRADDVNDGAGRLSKFRHVLGRNGTGVIRPVGKDDDGLAPAQRSCILDGQEQAVVKGRIISR